MSTIVVPDTERVVRAWLRTLNLAGVIAGRVFFGAPKSVTYPFVDFARIGGTIDRYTPVDTARLSFNCWADDAAGGKAGAFKIAAALAGHLADPSLFSLSESGVTTVIDGGDVVLGPLWRPDEEGHVARYVVDATVTCRVV
jgi:predicted secreted protein